MMKIKILLAVTAATAALSLSACSTSRPTASVSDTSDVQLPAHPSRSAGEERGIPQINELAKSYAAHPWADVTAPVTFVLERPGRLSLSARATIIRDKSVHMSMRVLGFEVAYLHMSPDSAWLVDKVHRAMTVMPLSTLFAGRSVTLGNVQDLLLGRMCYPGSSNLADAAGRFTAETIPGDTLMLRPVAPDPDGAEWYMLLSPAPALARVAVMASVTKGGMLDFSDQAETACGPIAGRIAFDAISGKNSFAGRLVWDVERMRFNTGADGAWTAPSYRRVSMKELFTILKTL